MIKEIDKDLKYDVFEFLSLFMKLDKEERFKLFYVIKVMVYSERNEYTDEKLVYLNSLREKLYITKYSSRQTK